MWVGLTVYAPEPLTVLNSLYTSKQTNKQTNIDDDATSGADA